MPYADDTSSSESVTHLSVIQCVYGRVHVHVCAFGCLRTITGNHTRNPLAAQIDLNFSLYLYCLHLRDTSVRLLRPK